MKTKSLIVTAALVLFFSCCLSVDQNSKKAVSAETQPLKKALKAIHLV